MSEIEQLRSASHWTIRDQPLNGQRCLELYEGCDGRFAGLCAPLDRRRRGYGDGSQLGPVSQPFPEGFSATGGSPIAAREGLSHHVPMTLQSSALSFIQHEGIGFVGGLIHRWRK